MKKRICITNKLRKEIVTFLEINTKSGKRTITGVAKELGISRNSLNLIKSGKTKYLNPETWENISKLMGLTLGDDSRIPQSFSTFVTDESDEYENEPHLDPMRETRFEASYNQLRAENQAQYKKLRKNESTIEILNYELRDAQKTLNAIKVLVGIEDLSKVLLLEKIKLAEFKLNILTEKQIRVQKLMNLEREKTYLYMAKIEYEKFDILIEELFRECSDLLIKWEKEINYSSDLIDSNFNDAKKYIDENFTYLIPHELKIHEMLNLINEKIINNRNHVFEDMFTKIKILESAPEKSKEN